MTHPTLMGLQILATGSCVPDGVLTNAELGKRFDRDPDTILRETGIRERRFVVNEQATSHLCVTAAERCLAMAGKSLAEVDLVLVASVTPDMSFPSVACMVQDRMQLNCPAVDLQSVDCGFLQALVTGASYVASGAIDRCLVIGGDCPSRLIHPNDVKALSLLGDGAGAVLLARGQPDQGLLGWSLETSPTKNSWLRRPGCGSRLPPSDELLDQGMQFVAVDNAALADTEAALRQARAVLNYCDVASSAIRWIIVQQAGVTGVNFAEALGINQATLATEAERCGLTLSGTIPLALDQLNRAGELQRGQRLLLTGGAPSWGAALFSW